MTRDAALTGSGQLRAERRGWLRWAASAWRFIVAVFFCLTPVTAVLVLGWLMRLMARESQVTMSRLGNPHRPCRDPHCRRGWWQMKADPNAGCAVGSAR